MNTNRDLLERYVELYNAGNLDGCMELYAEDATQRMAEGVTYFGRDSIRERISRELAGFPDAAYAVESFTGLGDSFADEWTFTGTHTRPYPMPDGTVLAPTGRRVEIRGMEFVQVRDGKIVIDNLYWDIVGVMVQLGLIPQPALA